MTLGHLESLTEREVKIIAVSAELSEDVFMLHTWQVDVFSCVRVCCLDAQANAAVLRTETVYVVLNRGWFVPGCPVSPSAF